MSEDGSNNGQALGALSEPLLTADEVSALLRVPRSTIYELTRTHRLPFVKIGRRTLFVRVDLDAWVVEQRISPRRCRRRRRTPDIKIKQALNLATPCHPEAGLRA